MKKILLFATLAIALVACGKKEEALPTPVTQPAADAAAPAADAHAADAATPAAEAPAAAPAAPAADAKPAEADAGV